ncbi:MAG: helix-turn-helix transcriptional regulator [Prevotellaceae bacterium]|nr:helix-turn-helix transcriptional regulator [Prevotellaceae bacterium]
MTLGERIKLARKVAGISQEELAKKIGTRQSQVTRWETNKATPRIETLAKIAEVTGVPLSELWYGNDNHEQ